MVDMGNVYNFLLYKMSHINAKCTVPVVRNTSKIHFCAVKSNSLLSLKGKSVPN